MKVLLCLCAAVAVAALSGVAVAETAMAPATLSEMGLSGLSVMDDAEALAVRGKGFSFKGFGIDFGIQGVIAAGGSFAGTNGAGTADGFLSAGRYFAGGEHASYAGTKTRNTEIVRIGPLVKSVTKIRVNKVFAGGHSSGMSL